MGYYDRYVNRKATIKGTNYSIYEFDLFRSQLASRLIIGIGNDEDVFEAFTTLYKTLDDSTLQKINQATIDAEAMDTPLRDYLVLMANNKLEKLKLERQELEEAICNCKDLPILRYFIGLENSLAPIVCESLLKIAESDDDEQRKKAREILGSVALKKSDATKLRSRMLKYLDSENLMNIALSTGEDISYRVSALEQLTNQDTIVAIAKNKEQDNKIRLAAINKMDDIDILLDIATEDSKETIRCAAKERIKSLR